MDDFERQYGGLRDNSPGMPNLGAEKDVAPLPNAYNTPIHLSGFVAAIRHLRRYDAIEQLKAGSAVAETIAAWLKSGNGSIFDVAPSTQKPDAGSVSANQYLSYWCIRALSDWLQLLDTSRFRSLGLSDPEERDSLYESLLIALEASKNRLSRIIATQSSSLHDAVGLTCALSSLALLARRLSRQDEETSLLVDSGTNMLLGRYVLEDGSFAPKATALTTRSGYSLVLSTSELAAILLHGVGAALSDHALVKLDPVFDCVARRKAGVRGWGLSARNSTLRRPAFAAATALSFIRAYHNLLGRRISETCARELGVAPYSFDSVAESFEYPSSVGRDITDRVLEPLKDRSRRNLATTSFILSGPPGNAKYEITRKIAQELRWPLLVLGANRFLRRGGGAIESEVEYVFDLLSELADTVVLLDEHAIEHTELGTELERAIVRSAVPGVQRQRGIDRILLIMAVSGAPRPEILGSRFGRVSKVFDLKAPNYDERTSIISMQLDKHDASASLRQQFAAVGVASITEGLTVEYLAELVRDCLVVEQSRGQITHEMVTEEVQSLKLRSRLGRRDEGVQP